MPRPTRFAVFVDPGAGFSVFSRTASPDDHRHVTAGPQGAWTAADHVAGPAPRAVVTPGAAPRPARRRADDGAKAPRRSDANMVRSRAEDDDDRVRGGGGDLAACGDYFT